MKSRLLIAVLLSSFILSLDLSAQIDLKGKLRDRLDRKIDQGLDKVEEAGKKKDKEETKTEEQNAEDQENAPKEEKAPQQQKPSLQAYSKYDFVPGDQVVFYEDFSQDNIGDFPLLWYTNKGGEVKTTNQYPGKWFMMKEGGLYYLEKGFVFPENFTLEFDVIPLSIEDDPQSIGFDITLLTTNEEGLFPTMYVPGKSGIVLNLYTPNGSHTYNSYGDGSYELQGDYSKESGLLKSGEVNHISIWVQKTRLRLYIHGEKIFDIPKALAAGRQFNQMRFMLGDKDAPLFSNFRIASAGADLRSKLLTEGKIISYGIYFDSGKDIVKPESYGSLKQIATILNENPQVKVKIVGHTDSDGDDASNLALSKKRAEAVKIALTKEFGIDGSRMETDGKGETLPLVPNTNAEGKAKNRRVEFIKL